MATGEAKDSRLAKRLRTVILRPETLAVGYSIFEIVWTWIQSQHNWNELVQNSPRDASLPSLESPVTLHSDMYLMLAAALGLWLRRRWSNIVAVCCGCVVFYFGVTKYQSILHSVDVIWSSSILTYWWQYAHGEWDLPRLCLALVVASCALIRLARDWATKRAPRNPGLTSE